jgi:hypothetical protein
MSETIFKERMVPTAKTPFVVFLFGIRINKPWMIHHWWPVRSALKRMLRELQVRPEYGFLGYEYWAGNPCLTVQYWHSIEALEHYARNKAAKHFPAWFNFNNRHSASGAVGIWHETYLLHEGCFEAVYKNMPTFGLGKAHGVTRGEGPRITQRESSSVKPSEE